MRFLMAICRIIFGITFILSGFFKLIDPVGTGLIMKEYFAAFHLGFLDFSANFCAIALSLLECLIGICILSGLRMKITSSVALIITSFFTLLTLYLALFNPIKDCGCFGEAIHLTNWQTFYKNLILLPCALMIFLRRKKISEIASPGQEWAFIAIFALFTLMIATDAYVTIPKVNFTPYRVGTDLKALKYGDQAQYETIFIYSKDGREMEFDLENLPDSTWTFVDSKTELVSGSTRTAQVDLSLRDASGEYRTELLYEDGPLVAVSVWDPKRMNEASWGKILTLRENLKKAGEELYIFSTSDNLPDTLRSNLYTSDYKSLITLNRSNGGVVYFNSGIVVYKWSVRSVDTIDWKEVFAVDYEEMILRKSIHGRLYGAIAFLGLIFTLILTKYFCGLFYKGRRGAKDESVSEEEKEDQEATNETPQKHE